ncbi:MAG: TPM domain-containing protein [Hyphomicrobiales bacterium]|nr:TPM domain-containing protein [Hyphomicrobiales bacterium]
MTLTKVESDTIAAAIGRAEAITSAEIVVVVDRIAGSWRSWSMVVALLLALAVPWPLIEWTSLATRTIFAAQLLVAAALIFLFLPQATRLKLVPRLLRRRRGHEAALREFTARGLAATRGRTGVLIYVALAERYAEVMTDTAISEAVDRDIWRKVVADLISAIAAGDLAQGLTAAVDQSATILAAAAPPRVDDVDELENRVIVI